jgi:hypothetical protein
LKYVYKKKCYNGIDCHQYKWYDIDTCIMILRIIYAMRNNYCFVKLFFIAPV